VPFSLSLHVVKDAMSRKSLHTILALLFAVSGATGLVYQIVWFKYLSLFLGNTTYAQTVVLAAFMGGLALGSMIWGRMADRTPHPVRVYALLEIGIAAYGFAFPAFFGTVQNVVIGVASGADNATGSETLLVLKLVAGMIVLLPPTILMGGTLPILVRFITGRLEQSGHIVATLYFLNSLGAVLGSVLGGFFLLRLIGLHATIIATSAVSLLIGILAFLIQIRPDGALGRRIVRRSVDDL
jgi:spermidine synthase